MTAPSIIESTAKGVGSSLSLKNLLVLVIVTIVVTLIVSKALKNTVVLTDANGNKLAEGEIKTKLAVGFKS
jgi:hypothetical protein